MTSPESNRKSLREQLGPRGFSVLVVTVVVIWAIQGLGWVTSWGWITRLAAGSLVGHFLVVLGVLAVGTLAYGVRANQRFQYGIAEIAIGAGGAWFACDAQHLGTSGLAILGSIYIVVRGIDNARAGWRQFREGKHDAEEASDKGPPGERTKQKPLGVQRSDD